VITVIGTLKGGSGKSTLTFNLGIWLALADIDTVMIDGDPQKTLTDVLQLRHEEGFTPTPLLQDIQTLSEIKQSSSDQEILIDTGTADMTVLQQALALCDRVLIPVPPSQADIWSTQRFLGLLKTIERTQPLETVAFINRGDTHHAVRETNEAAAALIALPNLRFIKTRLSQRTVFRRSFSEGLAVFELEARGKGSQEFYRLAAELFPHRLNDAK
jgi:chromosome partitioning protein